MELKNYNTVSYQSLDLTPVGVIISGLSYEYSINSGFTTSPPFQELDTFIDKTKNFIEGYFFDYVEHESESAILISEFKIDDLEILPPYFPIDLLKSGRSLSFQKKFIPLNIPIGQGKLKLKLLSPQTPSIATKINIVFKLNKNVNEIFHYKDFYKYQLFDIKLGISPDFINMFQVRPNVNVKKIKGISFKNIIEPFLTITPNSSNPLKNHQIGTLKMSMNSNKSNPVNIPVFNHFTPKIKKRQEFTDLDEMYEKSSNIHFVLEEHYSSLSIPVLIGFFRHAQIILKYEI